MHLFGLNHDFHDLLAESIDAVEVCPHALHHDLVINVDHVGVAHAPAIHDIGHLHARFQLVALYIHRKNADLAGLHVVGDFPRKTGERAFGDFLEDKGLERRTDFDQFLRDAGGDLAAGQVGDDRDLFLGLNPQAGIHRVVGARRELGVEGRGGQVGQQWWRQAASFLVEPADWQIF